MVVRVGFFFFAFLVSMVLGLFAGGFLKSLMYSCLLLFSRWLVGGYGEKAMSSICSPGFSSRWLDIKNVDLDRPLFHGPAFWLMACSYSGII